MEYRRYNKIPGFLTVLGSPLGCFLVRLSEEQYGTRHPCMPAIALRMHGMALYHTIQLVHVSTIAFHEHTDSCGDPLVLSTTRRITNAH